MLFPFINSNILVPYTNSIPNLYIKDISFDVNESFYFWIYHEMKKQNSMVILSFESNIFKVVEGFGDAIISINKNCNEQKEWINLEYEEWMEKQTFNNVFTIILSNPFLYMVPFPVKQIIIQTKKEIIMLFYFNPLEIDNILCSDLYLLDINSEMESKSDSLSVSIRGNSYKFCQIPF